MRWKIVTRNIRKRRNGNKSRVNMALNNNMVVVNTDWLLKVIIITITTATDLEVEAEDWMARKIR
jgi:hypothetical protein